MNAKEQNSSEFDLNYRSDIDGLRAFAVLIVILYHAKIPGVSGGFVGVDVFFVISGFLITTILAKQFSALRFSLLDFYARRAKRILPLLFTVLVCSSIAGFFLLLPPEFGLMAKSLSPIAGFFSNLYFLRAKNDYWEQTTLSSQPFVHTWSLAVEEQFYLVFPVLLLVGFLFFRSRLAPRSLRKLKIFITFLFVGSLAFSIYSLGENPSSAFYILPSRAWELLMGSLLALIVVDNRGWRVPTFISNLMGILGLVFILIPTTLYTETTLFPGINALLPCLGAAFIIFSGYQNEKSISRRLLSIKPLVFIGLLSYSLYLWHWPVFVFSKSPYWIYWGWGNPPLLIQLVLIFALSFITWKFVEGPFRHSKRSKKFTLISAALASAGIALLGFFLTLISSNQGPFRQYVPSPLKDLISAAPYVTWSTGNNEIDFVRNSGGRVIGDSSAEPSFMLVGESLAAMWGAGVDAYLKSEHKSALMMSGPHAALTGITRKIDKDDDCFVFNEARFQFFEKSKIRNVVLSNYWAAITPGYRLKDQPQDERYVLVSALRATVKRLTKMGKRVFIVAPLPESGFTNSYLVALESIKNQGKPVYGRDTKESYLKSITVVDFYESLSGLQSDEEFTVLDPAPILCDQQGCMVANQGKSIFYDNAHLSDYGANFLAKIFEPALR